MTFTFKLVQADETLADPPTMQSTRQFVTGRDPDQAGSNAARCRIVVPNDDEPPVLVVEDVAERASSAEL